MISSYANNIDPLGGSFNSLVNDSGVNILRMTILHYVGYFIFGWAKIMMFSERTQLVWQDTKVYSDSLCTIYVMLFTLI